MSRQEGIELATTFRLDHLVLIVDDLPTAIADYRALGFTVQFGGEHADGLSHNALISFQDGTYLELFALKRRMQTGLVRLLHALGLLPLYTRNRSPIARRFIQGVALGEVLADYALLTADLDAVVASGRQLGVVIDGPTPGGRARPDGVQLAWRLAIPDRRDLPFFIEDITSRDLRVPQNESVRHANGAIGIDTLICGVAALSEAPVSLQTLLAKRPPDAGDALLFSAFELAGKTTSMRLGTATLILAEPASRDDPLSRTLAQRGPGPYALILHTDNAGAVGQLDLARTHGAHITLV